MIGLPYIYGEEETVGLHIILSNLFWWSSLILVIKAYRNRQMWNVGDTPWTFLFMTFFFFGIRELGHLSSSPMVGTLRYILGIWSAIFMTTAFLYLFFIIYKRKKVPDNMIYLPFAFALLFPALLLYLWFSGTGIENIKNTISSLENLIWICGS